jgi:PAS domain S-box-containing protein
LTTAGEQVPTALDLENRLSGLLLEAAPDGTVVVDDEGTIVVANPQALRLFGYERDELTGHRVEELLPEHRRAGHRAHRVEFQDHPRARSMGVGLELEARRIDGTLLPVEISLSPVTLDGRSYTIASVRDVSERRRLQNERDRIQAALNACYDAVYLVDQGNLLLRYVNQGAQLQSGYSAEELLEMTTLELLPSERTDEDFRSLVEPLARGDQDVVTFTERLVRKDGRTIDVEAVMQRAPGQDQPAYLAIVRDISQRVSSERALQRAHEALMLAEDRERIARDLHDTVIQRLFASGLALQAAEALPPERLRARVEDVVGDIDTTIRELRVAIFGLRRDATEPGSLQREVAKIMHDASRALGFTPDVAVEGELDRIGDRVAPHVLAVLREAMANTARHARPTRVIVRLDATTDAQLVVEDDGVGISANALRGNGLQNMSDRARALGGTCTITARKEGGTRLHWQVPLLS